jgi:hypothetical protein
MVLDPVQEARAEDSTLGIPLAPGLDTLDGKTLGLWNNDKLNAAKLLELIRIELAKSHTRLEQREGAGAGSDSTRLCGDRCARAVALDAGGGWL